MRRIGDSGWQTLSSGISYRHFSVSASEGPLAHLASRGMAIGSKSGLLVALGLHETVPAQVLNGLLHHLLELGGAGEGSERRIASLQEEVWRLHETGGFYRCVPEIMAVCIEGSSMVTWCAGPNGIALAEATGIRLQGRDLRYAALRRLGVDLTALLPPGLELNPMAHEVSGLTQLEPADAKKQLRELGTGHVALLMSRGVLPFGPLTTEGQNQNDWWTIDCGWRHGMAGDVVIVAETEAAALAEATAATLVGYIT